MNATLAEALLLGLSTGPVCLAYCSPVLAPLLMAETVPRLRDTAGVLAAFLAGRLVGYLAVGLAVGLAGEAVGGALAGAPAAVIALVTGVALLAFGSGKLLPRLDVCRLWKGDRSSPLWAPLLGLLSGVSVCPPFIAAIAGALTLGSVLGAATYFLAFFAGTAVYALPLAVLGPLARVEQVRIVGRLCLVLSGLWFAGKGALMLALGGG